jgi:hypothetical protein
MAIRNDAGREADQIMRYWAEDQEEYTQNEHEMAEDGRRIQHETEEKAKEDEVQEQNRDKRKRSTRTGIWWRG